VGISYKSSLILTKISSRKRIIISLSSCRKQSLKISSDWLLRNRFRQVGFEMLMSHHIKLSGRHLKIWKLTDDMICLRNYFRFLLQRDGWWIIPLRNKVERKQKRTLNKDEFTSRKLPMKKH
jgi:hypothetical protein